MKAPKMNGQQRRFFRLYFGEDTRLHGNATRCYKVAYGVTDDRSAQVSGSRLLKRPQFAAWIEHKQAEALEEIAVNAAFVKTQAVRVLGRAMGDEPVSTTTITTDDQGRERIEHHEHYSYDPSAALKALQLVGQHKEVQAFSQVVEHTHTHQLEQRLAARSKVIEGNAAQVQPILPPGSADPARSETLIDGETPQFLQEMPGEAAQVPGAGDAKRGCIKEDVNEDREINEEKSASENRGA